MCTNPTHLICPLSGSFMMNLRVCNWVGLQNQEVHTPWSHFGLTMRVCKSEHGSLEWIEISLSFFAIYLLSGTDSP